MVSKTEARDSHGRYKSSNKLFDWDGGQAGVLAGAAVAGAMMGLAANYGRKFLAQSMTSAAGDWFDALKAEHELTLAVFDKIKETKDSQTGLEKRAAREAEIRAFKACDRRGDGRSTRRLRELTRRERRTSSTPTHGHVKSYLYELENMAKDEPEWLARHADFRSMMEDHVREEENHGIFPAASRLAVRARSSTRGSPAMMNEEGLFVRLTHLSPSAGQGPSGGSEDTAAAPWQCLYLWPDPHGHGALRLTRPSHSAGSSPSSGAVGLRRSAAAAGAS